MIVIEGGIIQLVIKDPFASLPIPSDFHSLKISRLHMTGRKLTRHSKSRRSRPNNRCKSPSGSRSKGPSSEKDGQSTQVSRVITSILSLFSYLEILAAIADML